MSLRLIEYYNEVMKNTYKNREPQKKYEMPIIIPIVIYTGNGKWNAATSLRKEEIRGIVPLELGSYKVFDVNNYSDDELIQKPGVLTKILSLEKSKDSIQVEQKANIIAECDFNEKEKSYLKQYITYIIGKAYGKDIATKLLKKVNQNVKEEKSMLIDVLYKVEERGVEKERKRVKKAIIINMLKSNYSDEEIKRILEITDSELGDIKKVVENETKKF